AGSAAGAAGTAGGGAGGANPALARGEYLVKAVLNCGGCHTPTGGAFLSGRDCFAGSTAGPDCLSSANLTNDATGLKNLTDQQIKDAFTTGKDPDQAGAYLFSNMPYYQFATLSTDDANAIVAYLRTVPAVAHQVQANAGTYATQPTAPQWAPVSLTDLPAAGTAAGAANGKYLAALTCVTCHTVDAAGATPQHVDATKAFQGGKLVAITGGNVQSSNLTPDATGIMGWSAVELASAIKLDRDRNCKSICGMRGLANLTDSDALDIAAYLMGIPAVSNTITMRCQ
ncbi:MAG TPA: c-type cytochrome, partial [Polyangia bacterium]|nr:c-type cytochrome [Polyangia bacterium]